MSAYEVRPVSGIGEITAGADLAAVIAAHATWITDGDIVVVTSKIVSKAEGRHQRATDREDAITAETHRVVARRGATRIVATRHGFVMAAAGVDASNVEAGYVLTLPVDPDASARAIRAALRGHLGGARIGVVVTDTMGRPWRAGLTDVAIGAAGLAPVTDFRGRRDAYGNDLEVTVTAVADEIASAAELAGGKLAGTPVTVVRGLAALVTDEDGPGAGVLVRPLAEDMFFLGVEEAATLGARAALAAAAGPTGAEAGTVIDVTAVVQTAIAAYVEEQLLTDEPTDPT